MPVLGKVSTKRIDLPSSSKGEDIAYVEVVDEILMDLLYDVDLEGEQKAVTVDILSRVIKDWNFTLEDGTKAPVTPDNVRLLPLADIIHITKESGLEAKFKDLADEKKRDI